MCTMDVDEVRNEEWHLGKSGFSAMREQNPFCPPSLTHLCQNALLAVPTPKIESGQFATMHERGCSGMSFIDPSACAGVVISELFCLIYLWSTRKAWLSHFFSAVTGCNRLAAL